MNKYKGILIVALLVSLSVNNAMGIGINKVDQMNDKALKNYFLSNKMRVEVEFQRKGFFLHKKYQVAEVPDENKFIDFFIELYDQPWRLFGHHPHVFSVGMDVLSKEAFLDWVGGYDSKEYIESNDINWACVQKDGIIEGKKSFKWLCYTTKYLEDKGIVFLFVGSVKPWVRLKKKYIIERKKEFLKILKTIRIFE